MSGTLTTPFFLCTYLTMARDTTLSPLTRAYRLQSVTIMGVDVYRWKQTRLRILERDRGICGICHRPGATSVDHIVPRAFGGGHEDANLRAAHVGCNSRRWAQLPHRKRRPLPFARPSRFG